MKKRLKLPKLSEFYPDKELVARLDRFNEVLNQDPRPEWVLVNERANKSKYLPIDKVEWLLKNLFPVHKIEVLEAGHMFNAMYCRVRVHYLHPILGEWMYYDGVGADNVQVDKGAHAADMGAIKHNAVPMGLPKAKTEAIKDACHNIGRIFGSDLNRADVQDIAPKMEVHTPIMKRHWKLIESAATHEELEERYAAASAMYPETFIELYEAKYEALDNEMRLLEERRAEDAAAAEAEREAQEQARQEELEASKEGGV